MRTKNIDVSTKSFVNLKPNKLDCLSQIYDRETKKRFVLKGKVLDFASSPFQIKFPYEFDAPETLAVEAKVASNSNIRLDCTVTAGSQVKKTKTFSLSIQELNDLKASIQLLAAFFC